MVLDMNGNEIQYGDTVKFNYGSKEHVGIIVDISTHLKQLGHVRVDCGTYLYSVFAKNVEVIDSKPKRIIGECGGPDIDTSKGGFRETGRSAKGEDGPEIEIPLKKSQRDKLFKEICKIGKEVRSIKKTLSRIEGIPTTQESELFKKVKQDDSGNTVLVER